MCLEKCPLDKVNWAYKTAADKLCIDECPIEPTPHYGDNSTGKLICVEECPISSNISLNMYSWW